MAASWRGCGLRAICSSAAESIADLSAADLLALATPPGCLLGRIANFINAELWGRPTTVPWGVAFPGEAAQTCPDVLGVCARHPSQLYEAALEGLILGRGAVVAGLSARLAAHGREPIAGVVLCRLRRGAVFGGICAPTRCAIRDGGQSAGPCLSHRWLWADHGADLVLADDRWWACGSSGGRAARHDTAGRDLLIRRIAAAWADDARPTIWPNACCTRNMAIIPRATPSARAAISSPRPKSARCLANCWACVWRRHGWIKGRPRRSRWPSLAPGRGTLMADVLRATKGVPGFHAAAQRCI